VSAILFFLFYFDFLFYPSDSYFFISDNSPCYVAEVALQFISDEAF
jgi:hypothetical protein